MTTPSADPNFYRSLVESITDGLMMIDREWRFTYVNSRAAQPSPVEPAELLGKNLWEMFPALLGTPLETHYRDAMDRKISTQFEMKGVLQGRWYLIRVYPSAEGITVYWLDHTTRKQADDQLEQVLRDNQRLAALLDGIFNADPSGLAVLVGPDLRFAYVNPAYRFLLPDPTQDPLGQPFQGVWPPPISAFHLKRFREILQTGQPFFVPGIEHRFPDGTRRWFTMQARRMEWDQQWAILIILWDVSEQKKAEEALLLSKARLKQTQEMAHLGSWELDLASLRLTWSDEVYRIFGLQPQAFALTYPLFLEMVHPDDRAAVDEAYLGSIREDRDTYEIEHRVVRRSTGEVRIVHEKCDHVRDGSGQIIRSIGMVQDISERKQVEHVLRESEERFRVLADSNPSLIWVTDALGNNQFVNRTYCEYFGITPEQGEGGKWQPFIHPEDRPSYVAAFLQAVQAHVSFQGEMRVRRKDGEWRRLFNYAEPRFSESGEFLGHVGNSTDITERQIIEEETRARSVQIELQRRLLEQREQERQQIARDLHDGPVQELTGIHYALEDIIYHLPSETFGQRLQAIRQTLIDQVAVLRDYAGELRPPALSKFGLEEAIRTHIESFEEKHPSLKIKLDTSQEHTRLPEEIRLALYRIYQEAMNNIAKHTQASEVTVLIRKDDREARLEVSDNGAGFELPKEWLTLARTGHLGLVGMRERAEAIGGTIEITSTLGRGTSIRVVVPLPNPE